MRTLPWCAALAVLAGTNSGASAQQAALQAANKLKGTATWSAGMNGENFRANGVVKAEFKVHPAKNATHTFMKQPGDFGDNVYLPIDSWKDKITDVHNTVANVSHDVSGSHVTTLIPAWFSLHDSWTAAIKPGKGPNLLVGVKVIGKDPWPIGPLSDGALFEPCPGGMDSSFSLFSGTELELSDDPDHPGSASAWFGVRVGPGVTYDPDVFWDESAGAIDLYQFHISAVSPAGVDVDLEFGVGTDLFTLEFRDHDGLPFDPLDPAQVAALESQIGSAFVDGRLTGDLTDLFTVGFKPAASLSSFTVGQSGGAEAWGVEVPGPGSLVILTTGVWILGTVHQRRARLTR